MAKIRIRMRYSLFWDVTQLRLVVITDVSGQHIVPSSKDKKYMTKVSRNVNK